jgi:cyclopropane fatty-acyl-phospholipid synthase-like methyltransferase
MLINSIIIVLILYLILKSLLKIPCYDYWQGYYTKKYYKHVFNNIVNQNSNILDVGVGTGYNLIHNKDIIKHKNLQIHGIDIDKDYHNHCYNQIIKYGLTNNVSIEFIDLFNVTNKYDYIIFGQSFPVIEKQLMTNMIYHCKKLLNKDGKIIFIHHLIDDNNNTNHIFYKIKPYIKYIPFIWIDSGKPNTKIQFENWLNAIGLKYTYNIIHTDHIFNTKLNIYNYICSLNDT